MEVQAVSSLSASLRSLTPRRWEMGSRVGGFRRKSSVIRLAPPSCGRLASLCPDSYPHSHSQSRIHQVHGPAPLDIVTCAVLGQGKTPAALDRAHCCPHPQSPESWFVIMARGPFGTLVQTGMTSPRVPQQHQEGHSLLVHLHLLGAWCAWPSANAHCPCSESMAAWFSRGKPGQDSSAQSQLLI